MQKRSGLHAVPRATVLPVAAGLLLVAVAKIVHRPGDEFFASTGFAQDKYRDVSRCDFFNGLQAFLELAVLTHDLIEAVCKLNLFAKVEILSLQLILELLDLDHCAGSREGAREVFGQ